MIRLPTRNDYTEPLELPEVTFFTNYNQDSYIECFQEFPFNTAIYVLNTLINFLGNNESRESFRIKNHNLSINDVLFANNTIGSMSYLRDNSPNIEIDLDTLISKKMIRALNVMYMDDIYFRFYYFEDYKFSKSKVPKERRNLIDGRFTELEGNHFYTQSYSLSSRLGISKDVRIIDFFFDSKYNDSSNLLEIFAKVVDAMILEHLRRATNKTIPTNTVTNFAPAYICFPEFITIDAIDFIYNYLYTTFNMYNHIRFYMEYKDFAGNISMTDLLKLFKMDNRLKFISPFYHECYLEIMWAILMNEIDSQDALKYLYLAYRKEILEGKASTS